MPDREVKTIRGPIYYEHLMKCHECAGTIDTFSLDHGEQLSLLDIDLSRETYGKS